MLRHKNALVQSQKQWSLRNWLVLSALTLALLALVSYGAQSVLANTAHSTNSYTTQAARATGANAIDTHKKHQPVVVTVFSPGKGDHAGIAGVGNVIDLALDADTSADNDVLSTKNGYKPFFNAPGSATFHPGFDPGAPGLVVLLSTTKTIPGTAFHGPRTNLAGLFQINGVARVNNGTIAETWNTWQVGKPIAGAGVESVLTVFVVKGTAPTVVSGKPEDQPGLISNVVRVHFTIAGAA